MRASRSRDLVSVIAVVIVSLPAWVTAESSVESFTSKVNSGTVKQTTTGSGNRQDLNVGSANSTKANSFNADVTTGKITQSSGGTGIVQSANIGSANNSKVGSFTSTVVVGNIEQVSTRSGDRQELDIGSVNNSTVNGKFKVDVKVKDGVKQTGTGEIVLGSVKNSSIRNFSTNLEINGKVSGNNIRIGSIVGQERFDRQGNSAGDEAGSGGEANIKRFPMPIFESGKALVDGAKEAIGTDFSLAYGCYCGLGWTGCDKKGDFSTKPLDDLDELCMMHDKAYVSKNPYMRHKADIELLSGLMRLSKHDAEWNGKPFDNKDEADFFIQKGILFFEAKKSVYEAKEKIANFGGDIIFNYVVGDISNLSPEEQVAVYSSAAEGIGHVHDVTASTTTKALGAVVDLSTGDVKGVAKNVAEMGITLYDESKGYEGKSTDLFERTGSILLGESGGKIGTAATVLYDLNGIRNGAKTIVSPNVKGAAKLDPDKIKSGIGTSITVKGLIERVSESSNK